MCFSWGGCLAQQCGNQYGATNSGLDSKNLHSVGMAVAYGLQPVNGMMTQVQQAFTGGLVQTCLWSKSRSHPQESVRL